MIVDEALDQVAEARIERSDIPALMTTVYRLYSHPRQFRRHHLGAMRVLESINRALCEAPDQQRAVSASQLLALTDYSVTQATAHLDALREAVRHSPRLKPDPRALAIAVLDALRRQLNTAPWTNEDAVSSARLLRTPEGTRGVILDATGRLNNVYRARPEEFDVRDVTPVRNYSTVTVYTAKDADTGKVRSSRSPDLAPRLVRQLLQHYGDRAKERRVLVVVSANPKQLAAFNAAFADAGFEDYAVTNWGRVDGRNAWRDFDTLLVGTLHYGTNTQDVNAYLAIADRAPDDESLGALDEIRAIRQRRIAADIAQAIGRLRLRTMVSADGACAPCDVFLRLPNGYKWITADRVLESVCEALPGAAVRPWAGASRELKHEPQTARKDVAAALVAYAGGMLQGTAEPISAVRQKIGAEAQGTWFRVQADPAVRAALRECGVTVVPKVGRCPALLARPALDGTYAYQTKAGRGRLGAFR